MQPRLIFLPGAGADPDFWRPAGDRLPAGWEKAYLAWPGLGDQPADPSVNAVEDLASLVEARMGPTPVDLIAQSMGGLVAMLALLRRPERVRRLVLTATSAGLPMGAALDWRETYKRNYPHAADWIRGPTPDLSARFEDVTAPVLLIWGDADPISPVAVGERLRGLLPNARLHIVGGGGHDLARTHAAQAAALIAEHLSAAAPG